MRQLVEILILPPLSLYLLAAAGLVLRRRRPRLGTGICSVAVLSLVLMSVPRVAYTMLDSLQEYPAISHATTSIDAEAIVVLTADFRSEPPEYGTDQPAPLSLVRARYAAALGRRTGCPILVSGGVLRTGARPLADTIGEFIESELATPVRWRERRSRSTRENALFSAELLARSGITRVALVTHAWHMPRAVRAFERAGLEVLPAPTGFAAAPTSLRSNVVPSSFAVRDACWAVHEWVGRAYYALRG